MKGYSCQCITHVGCCIKRKPRENIKVCVNVLPTSYRQVTETLPTVGPLSAHCQPTGSLYFGQNLSAVCWPTVGWLSADSWLTVSRQVFWGALPHNYRKVNQPTNFRTQFHFIIQTKSWLNLSGHYGRWCWGFSVPNILRLHVQPLLSKWDLHNKVWPIILILKMNISGLLYASYLVLLMNRNNIENHLTIIGY